MARYSEFAERFLAALYLQTERTGEEYHTAGELIEKFGLEYKPVWISQMAGEWEHSFFEDVSKVLAGYEGWHFQISAQGTRMIEEQIPDLISVEAFIRSAPAADRIVPLNHNQEGYQEIAQKIDGLIRLAVETNDFGSTAEERDRLLTGLRAAKVLWSAAELKIVQIKVGIVMAIEDAENALETTGKAVVGSLLVDLIKKFFKITTGLEF